MYDPNGELLFLRFPIAKNDISCSYADVAAYMVLGALLLAVAPAARWDEQTLLAEAREAFLGLVPVGRKPSHNKASYDEIRFVTYSFPQSLCNSYERRRKENSRKFTERITSARESELSAVRPLPSTPGGSGCGRALLAPLVSMIRLTHSCSSRERPFMRRPALRAWSKSAAGPLGLAPSETRETVR